MPATQIAETHLQPGMSRNARTIAPASWPLFRTPRHMQIDYRTGRLVGISRHAHTYENTAIIAIFAVSKNRVHRFSGCVVTRCPLWGQKRRLRRVPPMSALLPIADIDESDCHSPRGNPQTAQS